jgi:hypothetical protein
MGDGADDDDDAHSGNVLFAIIRKKRDGRDGRW